MDQGAFSGLTVVDFTQGIAGPHATCLLALHGADVIKIEPPEGDWGRGLGDLRGDHCAHSLAFNRGKRSIALDLKSPEGLAVAKQLVAKADAVVESFRPGVMKRLGLGPEELRAANPKLIYCSVSGFGQQGPNNKRPTVDGLIQAFTGMMVMNRTADGTPHRQGMIAVDVVTGLYVFQALSTALMRQFRFGQGCTIDASLMTAAAAFQGAKLMEHVISNGSPPPLYTPAGMYKTKDGYMVISAMRPNHFRDLFIVLDRQDIADDPRLQTHADRIKHGAIINKALIEIMPGKTTAEWLKQLQDAGIFCERVNTYQDYLDHPHVKAVNAVDWVEISNAGSLPVANIPGLPAARDDIRARSVPHIGEQNEAILGELGLGPEQIQSLYRGKALFKPGAQAKAAE